MRLRSHDWGVFEFNLQARRGVKVAVSMGAVSGHLSRVPGVVCYLFQQSPEKFRETAGNAITVLMNKAPQIPICLYAATA